MSIFRNHIAVVTDVDTPVATMQTTDASPVFRLRHASHLFNADGVDGLVAAKFNSAVVFAEPTMPDRRLSRLQSIAGAISSLEVDVNDDGVMTQVGAVMMSE